MKITDIELVGYKRLLLNGIDRFRMKIESPLQLILGTNGCGKSSLLWELSPLPAEASDFFDNGRKVVWIEHQGRSYVLTTDFGAAHEHHFLVDGEELNKAHKITVQRELVKQHFKITLDVHKLLTGRTRFTQMDTGKRKDWFLRLCDVNYDYALSVYNQLRGAQRDRAGAIRLEKKALVVESEKLMQDEDVARVGKEAQILHECLSNIMEHHQRVETDLFTLQDEDRRQDRLLTAHAVNLSNLVQSIEGREHTDEELQELIARTEAQALVAQTRIDMLADQHSKLAQKIAVLQRTGESTIASLEADLQQAQQSLVAESARSFLNRQLPNPEALFSAFDSLKGALIEVFSSIPSNADKRFSQPALEEARSKLAALNLTKNHLLERVADSKASLNHMREHLGKPDTTCPKCKHSFSLLYSEEGVVQQTQAMRDMEERLQSTVYPAVAEQERYITECGEYGSQFKQFHLMLRGAPALQPYWDYLLDTKVLSDNPSSGLMELQRIEDDLRQQIKAHQIAQLAQEIQTNLTMLKSVGEADLGELLQQDAALQEDLAEQTQALQSAQTHTQTFKQQFALRRQALAVRNSIRKLIQAKKDNFLQTVEHHKRATMEQLIRDLRSALASREHVLHTANNQKQVVQSMTEKIARLAQEEQSLAILVKELSPEEGLIAEGMLGFIKNYCDQMNALIEQIWSYELRIESCEVIEGASLDLDYRFPMIIGERKNEVNDVDKGSEGMLEIIDLAWRLTAVQYLGLQDAPLYLDEFGIRFDKVHRAEAAVVIRSIIEQHSFSNVFMISHDPSMYGALSNPQVCVLDATGILTPKEYNQHVQLA